MDTLSDPIATESRFPLSDADFAIERDETARHVGLIPFRPGVKATRSLWLIFESRWGSRRWQECLPIEASLEDIAADCDVIADLMEDQLPDEMALVVLRRPGPAEISETDEYIFRVLREAVAARQVGCWSCYVTGPGGIRKVS